MMYVRTKDGVYDTSKGLYTPSIKMWAIGTVTIYDEQILKQSENLEELCDEFVIEYADGSKIISIHDNTDDFLREHKDEIESGYIKNVYGAIWTDKGLIYVAKMNEKGELCLL